MEAILTMYWYEFEFNVEVEKSKTGLYESCTSALEHAVELSKKPENNGVRYEVKDI